jgi:hypothetical protein
MTPDDKLDELERLERQYTEYKAVQKRLFRSVPIPTPREQDELLSILQRFESELVRAFPSLLARVRAAEAIVSRLPKTADGVPIVPGMQLWLSEPERPLVSRIASWREFNNAAEEIYVYSTRAAAESASQSQAKAEGGGR